MRLYKSIILGLSLLAFSCGEPREKRETEKETIYNDPRAKECAEECCKKCCHKPKKAPSIYIIVDQDTYSPITNDIKNDIDNGNDINNSSDSNSNANDEEYIIIDEKQYKCQKRYCANGKCVSSKNAEFNGISDLSGDKLHCFRVNL